MIQLHLPIPPSVNKIWQHARGRIIKRDKYRQWLDDAAGFVLASKALRGHKTIQGDFHAEIRIDRSKCKGDLDNYHKAILDAAQRWAIISNDKNCVSLSMSWGVAPEGCTLTICEAA